MRLLLLIFISIWLGSGCDAPGQKPAQTDPAANESKSKPVFQSDASIELIEGVITAQVVQATDANNPVSYSISGGEDAALFTINSTSGILNFNNPPRYTSPEDANGDNIYLVEVTATAGTESTSQLISINVQPKPVVWRRINQNNAGQYFTDASMNEVIFTGSQFIAVGDAGEVFFSNDALSWFSQGKSNIAALDFTAAVWTGQQYVLFSTPTAVVSSSDGSQWTIQNTDNISAYRFYKLAWTGELIVAVGEQGLLATSTDASVWTVVRPAGSSSADLRDVVWNGSQLIATGGNADSGIILSSSDGSNWQQQNYSLSTSHSFHDVSWNGREFLITGEGRYILKSVDGVNWSSFPLSENLDLYYTAWGMGRYYAIGSVNKSSPGIYLSFDGINWSRTSWSIGAGSIEQVGDIALSDQYGAIVGSNGLFFQAR